MEPKTKRMLRIIIGVMAALLFGVAVLSFFTFSENNYVSDYGKIQKIVAANARVSSEKSSSGRFSFNLKETASSEGSEESDGSEESEKSEESASERSSASSGGGSSSVVKPSSSSSSSEAVSSSADAYSDPSASQSSSSESGDVVPIMGANALTKAQLLAYSEQHIPNMRLTCTPDELIGLYLSIGERYGVRGDIAYLQAVNETGWFKFNRPRGYYEYENGEWVPKDDLRPEGYYVVPSDNNFCGLGVTGYISENNTVCRFETAALGVEAHIQHLYAYACKDPLPAGTTKIDPRFSYVARGCAPNWNDLGNGKWATDKEYAKKILNLYANAQKY